MAICEQRNSSGPPSMRGHVTKQEIFCGKLKVSDLDASVRRMLELSIHSRQSGVPSSGFEGFVDDAESRALLLKTASAACVLLKNEHDILPIKQARTIAVIGSNGRVAAVSGGGSASMSTLFMRSPLAGIKAAAKSVGASVSYSIGAATHVFLPEITNMPRHPLDEEGVIAQLDFWKEEPCPNFKDRSLPPPICKPAFTAGTRTSNAFIADGVPDDVLASGPYIMVRDFAQPVL